MGSPRSNTAMLAVPPPMSRFITRLPLVRESSAAPDPRPRQNAFQRRAGGGHHKIPRQAGEGLRHSTRILLARGFAR